MSFFRAVASLLVIIAAFSSGAVLGHRLRPRARGSVARPGILDGALLLLCWVAAGLLGRSGFGLGKALVIGFSSALVLAFAHHCSVTRSAPGVRHSDPSSTLSRTPDSGIPLSTPPHRGGRLLAGWRSFARDVRGFQSRLFLSAVYFLVLAPFGILAGQLGDPLKTKHSTRESYWTPKESAGESLSDARRQSS